MATPSARTGGNQRVLSDDESQRTCWPTCGLDLCGLGLSGITADSRLASMSAGVPNQTAYSLSSTTPPCRTSSPKLAAGFTEGVSSVVAAAEAGTFSATTTPWLVPSGRGVVLSVPHRENFQALPYLTPAAVVTNFFAPRRIFGHSTAVGDVRRMLRAGCRCGAADLGGRAGRWRPRIGAVGRGSGWHRVVADGGTRRRRPGAALASSRSGLRGTGTDRHPDLEALSDSSSGRAPCTKPPANRAAGGDKRSCPAAPTRPDRPDAAVKGDGSPSIR